MLSRRDRSHRLPHPRRQERCERRPFQARAATRPEARRRPGADGGRAALSEADLEAVLDEVTQISPKRRDLFDESGDLDIAFSHPSLPRFRVNGFRQRGATSFAFRIIPNEIPNFSDARPAARGDATGRGAARPRPRHRRNRIRQDDVARVDARPHQPDPAPAHRHDRGSDRDPPSRSQLHRQSARGRPRHGELRAGAPARVAAGPRRDPDRRASRRRDGAHRAAGRRIGPSRVLHPPHDRRRRDDRPHDRVLPSGQAAADPLDPRRHPPRRRQPEAPAACRRRSRSRPSR